MELYPNFLQNMDKYVTRSSQSWFSRLGGSFKSTFGGFVLLIISIVLLWWNEGRAVKTARGLEEGLDNVISLEKAEIDESFNGKLIHVHGIISTDEKLYDDEFAIATNGLRLKRTVEMFQWQETAKSTTVKKVGGGQETTTEYSYDGIWSSELIDSKDFKYKNGHENPDSFSYSNYEISADKAHLGEFLITDETL